MLELLWAPLLACLILTGMHVYLGLHVLSRGVIFVDLALAQVAALGIAVAFLAGHPIQSAAAYWYALAFAIGGAALFALSRIDRALLPQEAVVGIVYAVSAAAAVLVVDRAPQGGEHIKQLLVGSILTVTPTDVGRLAGLYAAIGVLQIAIRRPLLEISFHPEIAIRSGRRVGWWDFCFYVAFGVVVTSSVRIAGVLLVFSYLVVPAAAAALVATSVRARLFVGWALGALVSVIGLWASFAWDLPTGAAVVTAFGAAMALLAASLGIRGLVRSVMRDGLRALAPPGAVVSAIAALAGLLLMLLPGMDHLWLDWIESAAPVVELAFLTSGERQTFRDARADVIRETAEIERLSSLQRDVQWGIRAMADEERERLRQFLASRGEIAAGDRAVLAALRSHARERQRFWIGLPLLVVGASTAVALGRVGRMGNNASKMNRRAH